MLNICWSENISMMNYLMRFRAVPGITKVIISNDLFIRREARGQLATVNGEVDEGDSLQLVTVGGTVTR